MTPMLAGRAPGRQSDVGEDAALPGTSSSPRVPPPMGVEAYDLTEAAKRSGLSIDELAQLVELGILTPDAGQRFTPRHLRRAGLVKNLTEAGIPLEGLGAAIRGGQVSLDFLEAPAFERFSALGGETFAEAAERTGVPVELLLFIREAAGSVSPLPDDRVRDAELAVIAMYHLQQTRAWTADIIEVLVMMLAAAGLHTRVDHPPAMCFLDITGFTRLTQEYGDAAAARLAEQLGPIVQRTSVRYGGRPVKWLGDGVMVYFPNPGLGVTAALEMVVSVAEAGLPPAHVGLHAGPLIFQEGDYYGQTVNIASRIADYAQAGEVIVSQAVVDASAGAAVTFREVGPVELKGVAGAMRLHAASRRG